MRSHEERIAEISRRSEIIIKARKKLFRHILLTCIPLVLCVGLCIAFFLPEQDKSAEDAGLYGEPMNGDSMGSSATGSLTCSYSQVKIQSNQAVADDVSLTIADRAEVTQIYSMILGLYHEDIKTEAIPESAEAATETADDQDNHKLNQQQTGSSLRGSAYTITLSTPWGAESIYTLEGNLLTDQATKQTRTLTESQLAELYTLLGLS